MTNLTPSNVILKWHAILGNSYVNNYSNISLTDLLVTSNNDTCLVLCPPFRQTSWPRICQTKLQTQPNLALYQAERSSSILGLRFRRTHWFIGFNLLEIFSSYGGQYSDMAKLCFYHMKSISRYREVFDLQDFSFFLQEFSMLFPSEISLCIFRWMSCAIYVAIWSDLICSLLRYRSCTNTKRCWTIFAFSKCLLINYEHSDHSVTNFISLLGVGD